VANYNVDIQVGIKGAQRLTKFRREINRTAKEVDGLNLQIRKAAGNKFENSIDRLNASVNKTSGILNRAAIGTSSFTKAANLFVKAERERDMAMQKTQKTLENARRSQMGMQSLEQREHQLLMRGNKLRDLRLRKERALEKKRKLDATRLGNQKALSNALIGGAFPLLFGQGLGASIGGATGGFAGGKMGGQFGFALSLVGTAVGSQFDRLAQQARELGEALRDPIKNLDLLTKAVGAANTPFGDTIATLKSLGLEGVAAEAVLEKFNKTFNTNKQSIQELGEESIRFTNELAKLGTAISLFIANPLADFLEIINDTLGNTTTKGIKREAGLEAFNLGLAKFAPGTPKALANIAAKSNFFGKTVDGQTFDEFRKGIEPGIFERRMNEAGLGGQSGTRNFADEDLQRLIKERRDFELSAMEGQLQIEQKSLTLRSEDLDVLKKRMDLLKIVEKIKVKELVDTNILSKEQKAQHDFELQKLDIERQISEELLKQSIIMSDPMKAALVDLNKEMAKFNDMRFQAVEFSKAFGSAFQESFKGIIKGTMSVQDAFRNMFSRIADHFLDMAAQMMANQLQRSILGMFNPFGAVMGGAGYFDPITGLGTAGPNFGLADGGIARSGRSYIVGERGPEMFTPGVTGTVTPNHELGGMGGSTNIVVNVDASGSSVEGDEDQGRELGRLISVAVQSELIQQQRPGGLLA
jgi:hypothetical protein